MTLRKRDLARLAQAGVLALAVLLSVLIAVSLASGEKSREELATLIGRYTAVGDAGGQGSDRGKDPQDGKPGSKNPSKKGKSPQDEQVDRISKRHVFSPDPPKKSLSLTGVLGDEAYFDGQSKGYKVGQSYKGAKITQIGPDWVQVEIDGKPQKLHVWGAGSVPSPSGPSVPPSVRAAATPPGVPARPPPTRGMPAGFKLTPEMIEQFKQMPAEVRKRALERMPAEVREKLQKAL